VPMRHRSDRQVMGLVRFNSDQVEASSSGYGPPRKTSESGRCGAHPPRDLNGDAKNALKPDRALHRGCRAVGLSRSGHSIIKGDGDRSVVWLRRLSRRDSYG
jgi:hypothetical protein